MVSTNNVRTNPHYFRLRREDRKMPLQIFYKKELLVKISQYSEEKICVEVFLKYSSEP